MIPASCACSKRASHLFGNLGRFIDRQRPARQALGEVLAGHELHREEIDRRVIDMRALEAVDMGDVRVIERRQHTRLALEARQAIGVIGHLGREHVDRDIALSTVSVAL
jgi:hypothetical protein